MANSEKAEAPAADEMSLEDLGLSTRLVNLLNDAGMETAQDILHVLAQGEDKLTAIQGVGDKTLEEVQQRLIEARLIEPDVKETSMGANPRVPEGEGTEQRFTFVIHLTVDERGKPRRTEVKHPKTGRKKVFPDLDIQLLVDFIQTCITRADAAETDTPPESPRRNADESVAKSPTPTSALTVSDVQLSRAKAPNVAALVLRPHEPSVIQARFQLQSKDADSLTAQRPAFEMKVYAHDIANGDFELLSTYNGNLAESVTEYTLKFKLPGLPSGLYRLVTLITLLPPVSMAGLHEGPMVQVTEVQPFVNAATPVPLF